MKLLGHRTGISGKSFSLKIVEQHLAAVHLQKTER